MPQIYCRLVSEHEHLECRAPAFDLGQYLLSQGTSLPPPVDNEAMLRLYGLILPREGYRADAIQKGVDTPNQSSIIRTSSPPTKSWCVR
jgi:hypothetical protein